jgi:hypothetical protein
MNFGWDQRFVTETAVFTTTVKNVELINLLGQFEAETLRVLRDIPGLSVTAEHEPGRDVDALLRFAGTHTPIAVEVKHRANAATARQFVHQAETRPDVPFLLVAGETTSGTTASQSWTVSGTPISSCPASSSTWRGIDDHTSRAAGRRPPG